MRADFKSLHRRTNAPPSRIDRITRHCISLEMISRVRSYFKDAELARMSDGTLCLVRDLGPVKGGKGMKHHEKLMTFSVRGLLAGVRPARSGAEPSAIEPAFRGNAASRLSEIF